MHPQYYIYLINFHYYKSPYCREVYKNNYGIEPINNVKDIDPEKLAKYEDIALSEIKEKESLSLDFDGTDDNFELTSVLGITSVGAIFSVAESGGGNDKIILDNRDSGTDGFRVLRFGDAFEFRWHSAIVDTTTNPGSNTKFLGFSNHDGSDAFAAVNGAGVTAASNTSVLSVTSKPHIGARSFSSATGFWDGTMNEIIIYDSDQTDNRTAIEANIGEVYSIDLPSGVDPGFDQVDGFVETWYDQSGNGKDATQATAGSQPKIVNAGALVVDSGIGGLDFDGDDFLTASSVSGLEGSISMFDLFIICFHNARHTF